MLEDLRIDQRSKDAIAVSVDLVGSVDFHREGSTRIPLTSGRWTVDAMDNMDTVDTLDQRGNESIAGAWLCRSREGRFYRALRINLCEVPAVISGSKKIAIGVDSIHCTGGSGCDRLLIKSRAIQR